MLFIPCGGHDKKFVFFQHIHLKHNEIEQNERKTRHYFSFRKQAAAAFSKAAEEQPAVPLTQKKVRYFCGLALFR